MTCFKSILYSCCLPFRRRQLSFAKSSNRKSSGDTSECEGGSAASLGSSHIPNGSASGRSRTQESYHVLNEGEALISSSPRDEIVSYGSQNDTTEKSSLPLITVEDHSEETQENTVTDNCEKLVVSKEENLEETSEHSNGSRTSLYHFEGDAEDGIVKSGNSENDKKLSIETKDSDVDPLPAYQSHSQLSTSTERIGDLSVADVNSVSAEDEHFDSVKVSGDILFGLNYNYKTGVLEVHIKECRNLSPVDTKRNRSDPYVKGYLLPDRSKTGKKKTKVKKNSLNPVFDEVLKFSVTVSELERRTLWLSVWHSHFGRNDFLGEMTLPLGHGTIENYGYKRHALKESLEKNDIFLRYNGDIVLSLKFVPSSSAPSDDDDESTKGDLHVLVKEAKNLIATYSNGTSNPFCKSYLLPEKHKASKQKTAVIKKNCNPKWNHTFVYSEVSLSDLKDRCLELTIWNLDKISSNNFLGGVRLSLGEGQHQETDVDWMDSVGEEKNLWQAMLSHPGVWNEGSLLLRTQMQKSPNR